MNDIEIVQTTMVQFDKVAAGIAALKEKHGGVVFEVATTSGMEAAKEARREVRDPRLDVERLRKAAKSPLLAIGRRLDTEAARITAELEKIEGPIDQQIKTEEARKEAEREARIQAEVRRVEVIQARISEIQSTAVHATTLDSLMLGQLCLKADHMVIDPAVFEEFTPRAEEALTVTRAALAGLLAKRKEHEAEQERVKAERAELAKLRAEAAERDRLAAEAQARADAEAKAERERLEEIARQERLAEARAHAQKIAADRAENERLASIRQKELDEQKAANDKIAEEQRQAAAAEAGRIAAERAQLEADQAAARKAAEQKPTKRKSAQVMPTEQEILDGMAAFFKTDANTARGWLSCYDWKVDERKSA